MIRYPICHYFSSQAFKIPFATHRGTLTVPFLFICCIISFIASQSTGSCAERLNFFMILIFSTAHTFFTVFMLAYRLDVTEAFFYRSYSMRLTQTAYQ